MAGRIVVFGATGYTGRLVAEALVAGGARPLLAARNRQRLATLAGELGGLETAIADVDDPGSVRSLLGPRDVLVSTVGPFVPWGEPAVEAAIAAGATYIDSAGEPAFIRRVFEQSGPRAKSRRARLVPAFGYDFVPGNVAGALALARAGRRARRIDIGYFGLGLSSESMSSGTLASLAGALRSPHFAWRDGELVTERGGRRVRSFDVEGRRRDALSVGGSEHIALPRLRRGLRDVNVYLGWFGPLSRAIAAAGAATAALQRLPGGSDLVGLVTSAARVRRSRGGPSPGVRGRGRSDIVAMAYDSAGEELARVRLAGVEMYTFTARMIAWGATRAAAGGIHRTGALGPVEAFGLDAMVAGCAAAGLRAVPAAGEVAGQATEGAATL